LHNLYKKRFSFLVWKAVVEDVMDGVPAQKTRLIVSGLVLKNEMYSVCFCSYNPLVHASVNSRRRLDFFFSRLSLNSTPR
jgi:hypothetical protein